MLVLQKFAIMGNKRSPGIVQEPEQKYHPNPRHNQAVVLE